jgi:hypothetical protein
MENLPPDEVLKNLKLKAELKKNGDQLIRHVMSCIL